MFNRAVSRLSRKRPPSDLHDRDGSSSSSPQNPKSTAKWAASLENLLEDPEGVKRFREFLKKEFSEENVLFWLACEDFKKTQDKKQMQEKAKEIYMTFLSSKASSQVNVEGQSRLNEKMLEEPHPLMFQKLQDQTWNEAGISKFRLGDPCAWKDWIMQVGAMVTPARHTDLGCQTSGGVNNISIIGYDNDLYNSTVSPGTRPCIIISPDKVESLKGPLDTKIFNLMKYDSYSRFLKSDLFLKHKQTEEEGEDPSDAQTAAKRASRIYNT